MVNLKTLLTGRIRAALCLVVMSVTTGSCTDPFSDEFIVQDFDYYFGTPGAPNKKARDTLLTVIDASQKSLYLVFDSADDTAISDAVIAAKERGVSVFAAADKSAYDDDEQNAALKAIEAAGISLMTNRRRISEQYDASAEDGRVLSNFAVADSFHCWVGSHGPNLNVWEGTSVYSIAFHFRSREICTDFEREAVVLTEGGLFSDEGTAAFGDFQHNKGLTDPYTSFDLRGFRFHIFFGAQERPFVATINQLMNARTSIYFACESLTQDYLFNVTDRTENRSHILNAFEYKSRIPELFGGNFDFRGVLGLNNLLTEGFSDSSTYFLDNGVVTPSSLVLETSIHPQLSELMGDNLRKDIEPLGFNLFVIDEGTPYAKVIFSSSDLRKRFYNDPINDIYPERMYRDYYDVSDSVTIIVEKYNTGSDAVIKDFKQFADVIFENAGGTF